jgi:hypothetical protein
MAKESSGYDYGSLTKEVAVAVGVPSVDEVAAERLRALMVRELTWAWARGRNIGRLDARPGPDHVRNPYGDGREDMKGDTQLLARLLDAVDYHARIEELENALNAVIWEARHADLGADVLGRIGSLAQAALEAGQ